MRVVLGLLVLLLGSCATDSDDERFGIDADSFLIFGHFYGECIGEGCVETFMLTDEALFEDTLDDYSGQNLNFEILDSSLFEEVRDLVDFFPQQLINEGETVIGCPDCADGGGIYIVISQNGIENSWRIDQSKGNIPEYLHDFVDRVNEKIALINQ